MSEKDNTLDDLILTDPEPEKGKSKSLLALLALVIVLIIVGAVLAKMIFSNPDDSTVKNKEDVKVEVTNEIDTNKPDTNLSNDLAPINDDPDLAPIEDNGKNMQANVDTINIDDSNNAKKVTTNDVTVNESSNNSANSEDKTADKLGVAPVTAGSANNNADIAEEPKRVVKHEKKKVVHHKPKPKPKASTNKHIYGGSGNVFIQVGSFTKGPESSFIRKIRRAGFKYRIKTLSNGVRRVYVGPFRSRGEASNVLGIVKSRIEPNAFIK